MQMGWRQAVQNCGETPEKKVLPQKRNSTETLGYMLLDVSRREKAVLDIQQRWLPESMCGNNAGMEK
jgi:hypothetical protein